LVPLILVASSVFLAFSVTVPNYRHEYQKQKDVNVAQDEQNRRLKDTVRSDRDQIAADTDQINQLKGQVAVASTEKRELWGRLVANQTTILTGLEKVERRDGQFVTAQQFFEKRTDQLWKENSELRGEYTKLAEVKLKLEDDLRQTRATGARLEGKVRLLQEQIQEREITISDLNLRIEEIEKEVRIGQPAAGQPGEALPGRPGTVGAIAPDTVQLLPVPVAAGGSRAPKIVGKIIAIRNDIASINVGKAQGVRVGMKMVITQNARFVGYLQIEEVDTSESAGIVKDKQFDPQVGDQVAYPPPTQIE
jgi:TolA-binding protein